MKRIIFIFLAAMMSTAVCSAAMSNSKVRKETRFLTDKMAYELNLSTEQYNDVYEINYDFISGIRYLMDDVLRGEEWALNRYYDYLDVRNDDLRWVLNNRQYGRFMQAAYFYRPVYVSGGRWSFRVYITYTNHNHFYFPRPYHYRTYCGGHYRTHYHNSYYRGRYHHPHYTGSWSIRNDKSYHTSRRSDFGSVNIRPNSHKRPAGRDDVYTTRRSNSSNNRISTGTRNSSTRRSSVDSGRKSSKEKIETTRTKNNDKSPSRSRVKTASKERISVEKRTCPIEVQLCLECHTSGDIHTSQVCLSGSLEQIAGINGALQFRSNEVYAFIYRITFFNQFFQGSVQRNGIFANQRNGTVKAQQFKIIVCPQCTCFRFPLSTCRGGGFCTFIYVLDERTCFGYCLIVL